MILQTLVVEIVGDISKYLDSLDKAHEKTGSFADSAVGGLSAIGGGIVVGGLTAAGVGLTAIGVGLKSATDEAMAAQGIMAQTEAVIKSTGGTAGMSADAVGSLAGQLSNVTLFEDDVVQGGENMLLTFTNIGKDVFPATTKAMLDMSQATGQDLKSSAVQLGKALNDPIAGISALSRVGVTFSETQKEAIKAMVNSGDVAGAQKLILAELNKEFGGSAEAAGNTASGTWVRAQNIWGNVKETIGGGLLPAIAQLGQSLTTYLAKPETQVFVQQLATGIGTFASNVITYLPQVLTWFQTAFGWLDQNRGVIVAALAVVGASLLAFAYTSLAAAIPAITAFVVASWPVIAVIAVIAGAAYLLYQAWTTNFGGIQEKTAAVWAWLEPKLQGIAGWVQTNIPIAIAKLQLKWGELQNTFFMAWDWTNKHLVPLFTEVGNLLGVTLFRHTDLAANVFKSVLGPALEGVVGFFGKLGDVLKIVGPYIGDYVSWAFNNLTTIIDKITSGVGWLADALGKLKLPSWLTPGSPTPWEMGLRGIGDALQTLSGTELPAFGAKLALQPAGAMGVGSANGLSVRGSSGSQGASGPAPVYNVHYYDNAMLSTGDEQEMARRLGPIIANIVGVEVERKLARRGIN